MLNLDLRLITETFPAVTPRQFTKLKTNLRQLFLNENLKWQKRLLFCKNISSNG